MPGQGPGLQTTSAWMLAHLRALTAPSHTRWSQSCGNTNCQSSEPALTNQLLSTILSLPAEPDKRFHLYETSQAGKEAHVL